MIAWLGQEPHRICGRVAANFVAQAIPGGSLSFLASPERLIQLHRIHHDQVDHHHLGEALVVLMAPPAAQASIAQAGSVLAPGDHPQLAIPAGHVPRRTGGPHAAPLAMRCWGHVRVGPGDARRARADGAGGPRPILPPGGVTAQGIRLRLHGFKLFASACRFATVPLSSGSPGAAAITSGSTWLDRLG